MHIPECPLSLQSKIPCLYHSWQTRPYFDSFEIHLAPFLHDGWIYLGTDDMGKGDLKLALQCENFVDSLHMDNQRVRGEFNLGHDSLLSVNGACVLTREILGIKLRCDISGHENGNRLLIEVSRRARCRERSAHRSHGLAAWPQSLREDRSGQQFLGGPRIIQ